MNSDHQQQTEDVQVETALRHFRESMHAWSEQEYVRPRSISTRSGILWFLRHRAATWGLACGLAVTAIGVPTGVHLRNLQQFRIHQAEQAAAAAAAEAKHEEEQRQAALQINDEELMRHVDQDIAQSAPDSLQPLASLMSDSTSE